ITAGLALIFLIFKSSLFDFVGNNDGFYRQNYGQAFVDALIDDRKTLFTVDALRSLIFVLLSAGALLLYLTKKLSKNALIPILAILILIDLVGINRRYVNEDSFVSALQVDKPYTPNTADKEILKDTTHYRVLDLSSEGRRAPARAAYFHNSLTGYHAAKLRRYNDVLEFYVMQNNMNVINMLNTKYIIVEDEQGKIFPYNNPEANGSAWFVNTLNAVETANEELLGLDSLNTKNEALISTNLFETYNLKSSYSVDSLATINLINSDPNYLKFNYNNSNDGYVVFSEIYYPEGWKALLDGEEVPFQRVNYLLRGMPVPEGSHTVEFIFKPKVVSNGSQIALASSILLGLWLLGSIVYSIKTS
ncbi:MAG: YfhO family protein, partial [Winogradskyella sp.]|nr:YfhO family protein [Winogradskyella sp.]